MSEVVKLEHIKIACTRCNVRELCLPEAVLDAAGLEQLDRIIISQKIVKRRDYIYRAGERFKFLYALRSGSCKTLVTDLDGYQQITGFHFPGELIGLDGISADEYSCDSIALEDSKFCEIPFHELEDLSQQLPGLLHQIYRKVSQEITQDHELMLMISHMTAEQRVAIFLLNLSARYQSHGFSPTEFHLRMTREEIGSYLGVQHETVSRILSKFQSQGLIKVQNRDVSLMYLSGLKNLHCSSHVKPHPTHVKA